MDEGTQTQRTDTVARVVKELLGSGEGAGSKISGFGVMLACIWLILEWQSGATRSEIDSVRNELQHQRAALTQEGELRKERIQITLQNELGTVRHEVLDLREFLKREHDDCQKNITAIRATDVSMQKQIEELRSAVEKIEAATKSITQIEQQHHDEDK